MGEFLRDLWQFMRMRKKFWLLPIILVLTMYAYLFFPAKDSAPLMPALQNRFWLHLHVSVAIIAYGALALSCGTAMMYFVKRKLLGASASF